MLQYLFAGEQFLLVEEQFVVHTKNGAHCILCRIVFLKKCSFGCFSRGGMQAVAEGRHRQLQQAGRQAGAWHLFSMPYGLQGSPAVHHA